MTKKISSAELEQIITEEIEKSLVDEGFGDFVKRVAGAGKAAAQGAVQKGKEKWKEIGQQQADVKQSQEALSKIATFIEYTRGMPEIENLIKSTKIGQHLFGGSQAQMVEQYESQISKMLKTLNPAELKDAVDEFMQKVSTNPQAATIMKKLTGQDVAAGQPVQAQAQQPQDQPQAGEMDTSGQPAVQQGPPESSKGDDIPKEVATGDVAKQKAKGAATNLTNQFFGDVYRLAAQEIEKMTDIDKKTKKEMANKVRGLAGKRGKNAKALAKQLDQQINALEENKQLERLKKLAGILKD